MPDRLLKSHDLRTELRSLLPRGQVLACDLTRARLLDRVESLFQLRFNLLFALFALRRHRVSLGSTAHKPGVKAICVPSMNAMDGEVYRLRAIECRRSALPRQTQASHRQRGQGMLSPVSKQSSVADRQQDSISKATRSPSWSDLKRFATRSTRRSSVRLRTFSVLHVPATGGRARRAS